MIDANRYPAQVFWSDEDEGYIAIATDLAGCSAFGETQQDALSELQDAIAAWIEAARAAGNLIPEPSQPAAENNYSGKILVRMPKSLHGQLARAAKAEEVSLNQHIVFLLTRASTRQTSEPMFSPFFGVEHSIHKLLCSSSQQELATQRVIVSGRPHSADVIQINTGTTYKSSSKGPAEVRGFVTSTPIDKGQIACSSTLGAQRG